MRSKAERGWLPEGTEVPSAPCWGPRAIRHLSRGLASRQSEREAPTPAQERKSSSGTQMSGRLQRLSPEPFQAKHDVNRRALGCGKDFTASPLPLTLTANAFVHPPASAPVHTASHLLSSIPYPRGLDQQDLKPQTVSGNSLSAS